MLGINKVSDIRIVRYFVLIAVLAFAAWQSVEFQSARLERLSETALSRSTDTEAAKKAVERLDRWWNLGGTEFLVRIATADKEFSDDRQGMAIKAVGARHSATANARIASLLVPHVGLARREAASLALADGPCNERCAGLVLHYLERVWSGAAKSDDVTLVAVTLANSTDNQIEVEHSRMVSSLYGLLKANTTSTLRVLHDTYGLGSATPSSFSLYVLDKAQLYQGCGLLEKSKSSSIDPPKVQAVDLLLRQLHCGGN